MTIVSWASKTQALRNVAAAELLEEAARPMINAIKTLSKDNGGRRGIASTTALVTLRSAVRLLVDEAGLLRLEALAIPRRHCDDCNRRQDEHCPSEGAGVGCGACPLPDSPHSDPACRMMFKSGGWVRR
jgi:hypothetical protein